MSTFAVRSSVASSPSTVGCVRSSLTNSTLLPTWAAAAADIEREHARVARVLFEPAQQLAAEERARAGDRDDAAADRRLEALAWLGL